MTTFRKEKKWPFDPTPGVVPTPGAVCVCNDSIFAFIVLCAQFPLIWYATWLLSQKYMVWPFDPTPWVEGVSVGKIFATMLLQKSSALIWYATWPYSEKSLILASAPPPKSTPGARTHDFKLKSRLNVSYLLLFCLHAKFQQKILTIALVIAKFKYLTFDPLGGVKGGGVNLWHCHAYLQALGNHGV